MDFNHPAHRTELADFDTDPDQIPFDFGDDPLPRTVRTRLDVLGPRGTQYVLEVAECALTGVVFAHSLRIRPAH